MRLAAAVAAAALSLTSCSREVPRLPALAPDAVILAFGNSLTSGTGAPDGQDYPAALAGLTGRAVINAGVPGEVSEQGAARLPSVLAAETPDLLILCHGGNDLLRKLPREGLEANLRAMVAAARDRGVPVVLVGVPQPGLFPESAGLYARVARDLGLPYEGQALPKILSSGALKSDPAHPNAAGYRRLAEALRDLLADAGAL